MNPKQIQFLGESIYYFHTPSEFARRELFYPVAVGSYEKVRDYRIHRKHYDSILILYVADGSLYLKQNGTLYKGESGDMLLVNCYGEHEYFTDSYAKLLWLHFDGNSSVSWFKNLTEAHGQALRGSPRCPHMIRSIMDGIKTGENEYLLSAKIYTLLCDISAFSESQATENYSPAISEAKTFMEEHLEQDLSVEQIATAVHFSPSYFSKIFKDSTKMSPYEYLLSRRIERAKKLLLQTRFSMDVIAERSGFHSTPHFICAFKQATGLTPLKFRKLNF
ncbi:MAG: helix-turn-helix domain-containing protein [Clostridia bacterium]|nr:helix-turn-helix domain-containing protein [Clostridia bacterium]